MRCVVLPAIGELGRAAVAAGLARVSWVGCGRVGQSGRLFGPKRSKASWCSRRPRRFRFFFGGGKRERKSSSGFIVKVRRRGHARSRACVRASLVPFYFCWPAPTVGRRGVFQEEINKRTCLVQRSMRVALYVGHTMILKVEKMKVSFGRSCMRASMSSPSPFPI